jgi:DNA (cytosine-5)-methyltransferase 1
MSIRKNNIRVLDIFSGCGGLSLGFQQEGYNIIAGLDIWPDAIETFKKNHVDSLGITTDLSNINFRNLSKSISDIDLIIGGPPCQGFSISGKRNPNDARNRLYINFVDTVKYFIPKAFVLENVPNLISMSGGKIKESIIKEFQDLGYNVQYKIMLASDFGVPQNRKRVFFVGIRNSKSFKFPDPEISIASNRTTTFEAISDLPENSVINGSGYEFEAYSNYQRLMRINSGGIYNHEITIHSNKTINTIALVPDGGNYKNLPKSLQNTRKVNIAWTRYSSSKPSLTIDTGHRHHFHYKYNRIPTVRESARLQSFPDNFIFYGSKTSQYKQVGNAVPPMMAAILAKALKVVF